MVIYFIKLVKRNLIAVIFFSVYCQIYAMESKQLQRSLVPSISQMMTLKHENKRIIDEPFEYEMMLEVCPSDSATPSTLETPIIEKQIPTDVLHKVLSFKISYICEKSLEATEEIVTFGDDKIFHKLLQELRTSLKKEKKLSSNTENSNESDNEKVDYYNAALITLTNLSASENMPGFLLKLLFEEGVNRARFVEGFSKSVELKQKYLTRKRKQSEPEELDYEPSLCMEDYREGLANIEGLNAKFMALINGEEGMLTLSLTLKTIDSNGGFSPLPSSTDELKDTLKNWALGKIFTLFNRKFQILNSKKHSNSMYQ